VAIRYFLPTALTLGLIAWRHREQLWTFRESILSWRFRLNPWSVAALSGLVVIHFVWSQMESGKGTVGRWFELWLRTDRQTFPWGPIVIYVLTVLVLIPIVEEVLFRGVLLQALSSRWPHSISVVLSSLVFAVYHPTSSWVFAGSVGLILGVAMLRSKSILVPIGLHAFFNLVALVQELRVMLG
jgi:membrane protease YdiL (CAAX protease family)